MRYIIMCGVRYRGWETPKHLLRIHGEAIVERTIRLLKDAGITDIAISANDPRFNGFGVPMLHHDNLNDVKAYDDFEGYWCNAFYPMDEPVCYVFGDVVFSPAAIRKIVETGTDDIEFFGSAPPFAKEYMKLWAEPFAFKVVNQEHLKQAIRETKEYARQSLFNRKPLAWELWAVIKGFDPNAIVFSSYKKINDYTCDIDEKADLEELTRILNRIGEIG